MKSLLLTHLFLGFFCLVLIQACSKPEDSFLQEEKTSVAVTLSSTYASYDEVNIDVKNVLLKVIDNESDPNCWLSLNADHPGVYNMLELAASGSTLIVDNRNIPEGLVYEVWLELGENNTLVKDGSTYELSTPHAHQSGLKIRSEMFLKANNSYSLELQIDLQQSIIETNTEGYFVLKPVLNLVTNTIYSY